MAVQTMGDADDVVSDINVTPLVDVMLVLLVVFIVTAPLLTNAIKVHLPQTATTAPVDTKKAVVLSVDAQGRVYVDRTETPLASLQQAIRVLHEAQPDLAVHLSADESANYGLVAKVMAAVDRAGVNRLSIMSLNE